MSLHTMNSLHLVPKKDSVANQLVSGALQLARNTTLFLDEMQLEQSQLDTSGVGNIPALGNLISWQKVGCDFNYHKMEFPCNIKRAHHVRGQIPAAGEDRQRRQIKFYWPHTHTYQMVLRV
ncbi:mini-chromosome maintenance complex-binding protein-like [Salmo salar]|uniref:Mini-chromosome maintenance complex-binding protein n=1 Tax=Salmo salar TaxID=8030 RepID=A0A1S3RQS3_SALSA|nr:mini-chromosome maintenance complex-binding protein-like [Salmo salar]